MEFTKVIMDRRSVRKYSNRKPSKEQLMQILEAGRLAPTAYNKQPQKIYVLETEMSLEKMDKVHPCRYGAPIVLLVCADAEIAGPSAEIDGTIVATHMLLAAYNAGVDSVWAGVLKRDETRKIFNLPETVIPICFIDLGFQPTDNRVNLSSAKRNPLESMVTIL